MLLPGVVVGWLPSCLARPCAFVGGEPTYGTLTLVDLASLPGTSELDTHPTLDADRAPGLFRAPPSGNRYAQTASLAALGECLVSLVRNANALEAEATVAAQATAQTTAQGDEHAEGGGGGGVQLDRMLRQFRHTAQVRWVVFKPMGIVHLYLGCHRCPASQLARLFKTLTPCDPNPT